MAVYTVQFIPSGYQNLRYLLLKAKRIAVTNVEFIAVSTVKKAA
jgi:hypothetical protein